MNLRGAICAALALALSACSADTPTNGAKPAPALWEIRSSKGEVEGWMLGTIHALPDDVEWRTALIDDRLIKADVLVVEVAGLQDQQAMNRLFRGLAYDQPHGPLVSRLTPENRERLVALLAKSGANSSQFDGMESWAAALALAQLDREAKSSNGVDRALLADFSAEKVVELEGAAKQLALFDSLPVKEQDDLLNGVFDELAEQEQQSARMADAWLTGDLDALAKLTTRGILADPELRQALLVDRNRDWTQRIDTMLDTPQRPFIAVGTGHMIGPEGLPERLKQSGYTVSRIQ